MKKVIPQSILRAERFLDSWAPLCRPELLQAPARQDLGQAADDPEGQALSKTAPSSAAPTE